MTPHYFKDYLPGISEHVLLLRFDGIIIGAKDAVAGITKARRRLTEKPSEWDLGSPGKLLPELQ